MKMLLASAVCVSLLVAGTAIAQDKKGKGPERSQKVLIENDRVRATETTYPPGAGTVQPTQPGYRITRVLSGGTLERTHGDGKKETINFKTGDVLELQAAKAPYHVKNTGKSTVVLYSVTLKAPKK